MFRLSTFAILICFLVSLTNPVPVVAQSRANASPFSTNSPATDHVQALVDFSRYRVFPCSVPISARNSPENASAQVASGPHSPRRSPVDVLVRDSCAGISPARYALATSIAFLRDQANPRDTGLDFVQLNASQRATGDYSVPMPFLDTAPETSQNTEKSSQGFHWWPALQQSFNFLLIEHGFRIATDPFLRYLLWHKPFWHDWAASDQHFYFNQWGDGDDFIVNYIGHPLEGAVTGYIQIVNDPKGRSLQFGRSRSYWMSRLRAMAFAAVYSANFEAGPILSEAAIGSEGGYFYKPGCDPFLTCQHPGKKAITNNTGWVDFTVTPLVGTGWIVLEDAIETELVDRWAKDHDSLGWKIFRASLSPGHVMANFVAGKTPWYRYGTDGPDGGSLFNWHQVGPAPKATWEGVPRWELGVHYAFLNLPVSTATCPTCRVGNSGFGANAAYRITKRLWVDSDVNYFPGSGNYAKKGTTVEGLFGPRYGYTGKSWGLYFKLRPGFIYYDKTLTADSGGNFTNATRFAFDVGSIFEWYASAHSSIRFDAGTTVVRYLTGRDDPRQPPCNILSSDYIVSQSNFQIGTGYTYRF